MIYHPFRLLAHAAEQPAFLLRQPGHAAEIQAGVGRFTVLRERKAGRIYHRQLDQAVIEAIPHRPNDRRNTCRAQVQLARRLGGVTVFELRDGIGRHVHAG